MRNVDRKKLLALQLKSMLLRRLACYAHDLCVPADLLTTLLSLARSEGDFATIAAAAADVPSLSDCLVSVLFSLGPYAERQFLLSLISDQSCLQVTRGVAGDLLLEEPDSHRSPVETLALAIYDAVCEQSIWSRRAGERPRQGIGEVAANAVATWHAAFPNDSMGSTVAAALQAVAGDTGKPSDRLDFLLRTARLSTLPSTVAWVSGELADMDSEAAEPIVDAIALAAVHVPLDEEAQILDAGFTSRYLEKAAGHLSPERLLLVSVYQPQLAASMLFPVDRRAYMEPSLVGAYGQLLFRHSDCVDPERLSLALESGDIALPQSRGKERGRFVLLHTILTVLRARQLACHDADIGAILAEYDERTAASDPILSVQVANARALISCMDHKTGQPLTVKDSSVDATALEMCSVIVRSMPSCSCSGDNALSLPASTAIDFLRTDVLIRCAFDNGSWDLVTRVARMSHGVIRLLAQFALSLSPDDCVARQCVRDFECSDTLDEKLGHLVCLGLCPSDYALSELRLLASSSDDPFASLTRSLILHNALQYPLSRDARRRLYSRAYSRFIASALPSN